MQLLHVENEFQQPIKIPCKHKPLYDTLPTQTEHNNELEDVIIKQSNHTDKNRNQDVDIVRQH